MLTRAIRTPASPVVMLGGSAGSVEPLLVLVERLPRDLAVPVAVVVHTPRHQPSGLVAALSHRCPLAVREPVDKEELAAGTVFVAAPGYHLLIERGPCFGFSLDPPENFSQPSIDVLFESAADVLGERLIAVILSGANRDGAQGLRAVWAAGGLALVQSPEEATSPEMPRAALAACPDAEVLPAGRIADRIVAAIASRDQVRFA